MQVTLQVESEQESEPALRSVETFVPERSSTERWIALATFLLSLGYLLLFRRYTWIDPDEGIILQGAQRILDGQVVYRDFFSFFTPGSYYLTAFCLRLFGNTIIVAHTALAVIGAACSPFTYLLARRVCSRSASLLVTGLVLVTALPMRFVTVHNWDSTLLACISLYCALRLIETCAFHWALAAGSFICLTGLFEQSKGACLLLGIGAGFVVVALGGEKTAFSRRNLVAIAAGLAWPMLATFAYFASHHALTEMVAAWLWPLQNYTTANHVPYGYGNLTEKARHTIFSEGSLLLRVIKVLTFSPTVWLAFLPLIAIAVLFRAMFRLRTQVIERSEERYYVLVSCAILGLLLSVVIVRADYEHFVYLQPVFLLILSWLLSGTLFRNKLMKRTSVIIGFVLSMLLMLMGAALLFRVKSDHVVSTRRGDLTSRSNDEAIEFLQANVLPGERILVYPYESSYYYLTGTYSPGRYEYFQPGMHTGKQVQEMIDELSRNPVRIVLYDPAFAEHARASWPNTPASALMNEPIAAYILREYRSCRSLRTAIDWEFQVMTRRDQPCP